MATVTTQCRIFLFLEMFNDLNTLIHLTMSSWITPLKYLINLFVFFFYQILCCCTNVPIPIAVYIITISTELRQNRDQDQDLAEVHASFQSNCRSFRYI